MLLIHDLLIDVTTFFCAAPPEDGRQQPNIGFGGTLPCHSGLTSC